MRNKNNNLCLYVSLIFFVSFLVVTILVVSGTTGKFDEAVLEAIPRSQSFTNVMKVITTLGDAWFLLLVGALTTIFIKDKKDGAGALLNLGLIAFINSVLKKIIRRPRPSIEHLSEASGFSFPSGHSASSTAFYGYLIHLVHKNCKNKVLKWGLMCLLSLLILGIGLSRMYLGVHYPSDVVGGFLLAIAITLAFIWIKKKMDI